MKKLAILTAALILGTGAMAQDVKVKKGKVTLTEAEYNELKSKADQFEPMSQKLTSAQNALRKERERNQMPQMANYIDSASYAIGKDLADMWKQQNLGLNLRMVAQSLLDEAEGRNTWNQRMRMPILQRFQQEFEMRQRAEQEKLMASLQDNIKAGEEYLAKNAKEKGVKVTKSGLQYKCIKAGNGKKATANSTCTMHYTGKLINGTVFDSSVERGTPITGNPSQFIKGWTEGLQLMDEGSKYMLYIPYQLAYGEQATGSIPPGSALIFEVELLEVK